MIRVRGITKVYYPRTLASNIQNLLFGKVDNREGGTTALSNVSFEINRGEVVGMIGPNGAGKTTMMKILTGLLRPTNGEVWVDEFKPADLEETFKKEISFFSATNRILDDGVIIRDSFEDKLGVYGSLPFRKNPTVQWLVERSQVEEYLDRVPEELSTGQRTIVEVIYSLIHKPRYVFFDEPTLGLDLSAILLFKQLVRELNQKEKMTFVITSHDLQNVVDISERIILINRGKVLVDKTTTAVIRDETFDRQIEFILSDKAGTQKLPPGIHLEFPRLIIKTSKKDVGDKIKYWLPRLHFSDLRITEPPIEEIFGKYYHVAKTKK